MSPMKNEGLSYPIHFLKIWGSDIRKNFHENEQNKSTYVCDEMQFIHNSPQK